MPAIFLEDLNEEFYNRVDDYALEADDIISFAKVWDPMPYHTDIAAAKLSIFKGLTASSCHITAIATALYHRSEQKLKILAMLGKDKLRFPNPARVGDKLSYVSRCLSARPSQSKPSQGIAVLQEEIVNQDDVIVMSQEVTLLVATRASRAG